MSRGMSIEELSWLTGRFSDNGRFRLDSFIFHSIWGVHQSFYVVSLNASFHRYEEFLDWVLPLGDEARRQRPPQLSGPVPTSLNYSVAMRVFS
jgi:hypothetical protein